MRRALLVASACAFVVGSTAAPAVADSPPEGQFVTVHHVAPVLLYRLEERLPDDQQIDGGTIRVTYTCHQGSGEPFVFAFAFAGGFLPPTFGEPVPCDDRRHTLLLSVSRKTAGPFEPPGRFVDTDVFIGFDTGPGGEIVPGDAREPVRIRFLGF
jgi:hypothetical protein